MLLHPCSKARSLIKLFARNTQGAVALIFALLLVPLIVAIGVAVDYGYSSMVKARLDAALDAAGLAAISKERLQLSREEARTIAENTFRSQANGIGYATLRDVSATVTDQGRGRTIVMNYRADMETSFMRVVGLNSMDLNGTASATSNMPSYIDFYMLLDNTPSMGLGATQNDIARLQDKFGCAFACHNLEDNNANSSIVYARNQGINLRIDVVRQATQKLFQRAEQTQTLPNQYRVAAYNFGYSSDDVNIGRLQRLTQNLAEARRSTDALQLMPIRYSNQNADAMTDINRSLREMNNEITQPGQGSHNNPQKVLFLVSDGVNDRIANDGSCTTSLINQTDDRTGTALRRCVDMIDTNQCRLIKERGIKIAVLYTSYLPLPSNPFYNQTVKNFSDRIPQKMRDCASHELFFEVSPTQGIQEAMLTLFDRVVLQARVTN